MTSTPERSAPTGLILAPNGRDAAVAASLVAEIGVAATVTPDLRLFHAGLSDEISFAVVTDEAVRSADLRQLASWVGQQPSWSDLPFIVLTQRGGGPERNPVASRLSDILGNVTFLERPFHPTTFISMARSALKSRLRQYDARSAIEALHESEERLRTALLAGHLGSWELEIETQSMSCSAICKAAFGRGPDEPFDYQDLLASVHPEDRDRMQEQAQQSIRTGADYVIEYRNIWPDGSLHWAEVRARLVADRKGRGSRLVGVTSDITARKTAEDDLRQLNETLESRVASRTAELERAHAIVLDEITQREQAEEQLRQAQKMETIGQLTGGVAHDFNNLLMAILGNLDLLRKHVPGDPKAARLIDGALQGATRGAALTQRLLAFARRQDLHIAPVDLRSLIDGIGGLLERSVGAGIDLRLDLGPSLPPALIDANQVEMALLNLVLNARDAMPEGGIIEIRLDLNEVFDASDLAPGPYLRLSVIDSGHGMDRETLQRAVDPFFSTKGLGKGTGLGLSMIHGLAGQLKGALRLASELGRGTTAELWLPATAPLPEVAAPTAEIRQESDDAINRTTILLVDDDALIAMSTVDMLEDLGHEVIEADSGADAVAILKNNRPIDLLITDYSMPGMTGVQLAKAARLLRPNLPILLTTGYAELPNGVDIDLPRLGKPYRQEQLATEIAKVLRPMPALGVRH